MPSAKLDPNFEPPTGAELSVLTGRPRPESEAYLYLAMLNALADSRFPSQELRRYVRLRYGRTESDSTKRLQPSTRQQWPPGSSGKLMLLGT
jgi:hypothetical protein